MKVYTCNKCGQKYRERNNHKQKCTGEKTRSRNPITPHPPGAAKRMKFDSSPPCDSLLASSQRVDVIREHTRTSHSSPPPPISAPTPTMTCGVGTVYVSVSQNSSPPLPTIPTTPSTVCFGTPGEYRSTIEVHNSTQTTHTNERPQDKEEEDNRICNKCFKKYSKKFNCIRHQSTCTGPKIPKTEITICKYCRKSFSSYRSRQNHEKICKCPSSTYNCSTCNFQCSSQSALFRHERQSKHNYPSGSTTVTASTDVPATTPSTQRPSVLTTDSHVKSINCRFCTESFRNHALLYKHRLLVHEQTGAGPLQDDPWENDDDVAEYPWLNEDGSVNEEMKEMYDIHRRIILRERVSEGVARDTYNFPVANTLNTDTLMEHIQFIYENSQTTFKINIALGLILQHVETGAYRFFVPYYNETLFLLPQLISNTNDIEKVRERLAALDLTTYIQKQRPNSKWKPVMFTNVFYYVYKSGFPLGLSQPLPDYVKNSSSIISFERNPYTAELYSDYLCFFRCVAYHRSGTRKCERLTIQLHAEWVQYGSTHKFKNTDVTLHRMPDLEQCFKTNINVYELDEDKHVSILYRTRSTFTPEAGHKSVMNLNMYEDHLSYITKFKSYAKKFRCRMCSMLFDQSCNLNTHEKTCSNKTKLRFPGGYFDPPKTVFHKLAQLGINVDLSQRDYPWFITFDMEAMLTQLQQNEGDRLNWTSRHEPVSVSICSNVEGYTTPKFILDPDLDSLLSQMIGYMNQISDKVDSLARVKWQSVFESFRELENKWVKPDAVNIDDSDHVVVVVDDDDVDDVDADDDDYDDYDNDDDDDDGSGGAMETDENELPSAEFVRALSKENVFYIYLKDLEASTNAEVQYNDWDSNSQCSDTATSSFTQSIESMAGGGGGDDDDDDDDDDNVQTQLCSMKRKNVIYSDDDDDDDENGGSGIVTSSSPTNGNDVDYESDDEIRALLSSATKVKVMYDTDYESDDEIRALLSSSNKVNVAYDNDDDEEEDSDNDSEIKQHHQTTDLMCKLIARTKVSSKRIVTRLQC